MTVANFNWKKGLLFGVAFLFAACCGIGAIASKDTPAKTAQEPSEATKAVPTAIPTPAPTEVPCRRLIAVWKSDMGEVMSAVITASEKASDSKMQDAINITGYAIELLNKVEVPTCDERVQTFATTMNKGLNTMITQYTAMKNGDAAMADVHGLQAMREIKAATDILSDLNKDYP
jgi:hypothetical protein